MPFPPTAQTALNVGLTSACTECRKARLLYSKRKLNEKEIRSFKRCMNGFSYVCGSSFQEIVVNSNNPDENVFQKVFARENLYRESQIGPPNYSCKIFKPICIHCGRSNNLVSDEENYPQCGRCQGKPKVKNTKRKKVLESDLHSKRQKK